MRSAVTGLSFFALVAALAPSLSSAQALSALAKSQGCVAPPVVVEGTELYKCRTQTAMSYFSGPPAAVGAAPAGTKRPTTASAAPRAASPSNFPRVDSNTQRERDDVRKRVLTEELATEVKLLVESEVAQKTGATPMPDETLTSPKYLDRQAKLRTSIDNHNRNIQALNKELERLR